MVLSDSNNSLDLMQDYKEFCDRNRYSEATPEILLNKLSFLTDEKSKNNLIWLEAFVDRFNQIEN